MSDTISNVCIGKEEKIWLGLVLLLIPISILLGWATTLVGARVILVVLLFPIALTIILNPLYGIMAYLALAPLYNIIAPLLPGVFQNLSRDLLLAIIVLGWIFNFLVRSYRKSSSFWNWKVLLVLFFTVLTLLQILNSESLLTGVIGFRILFRCLPVYFVAVSLLNNEQRSKNMRLFFNAFLFGALINTLAGAIQFSTISLLQIMPAGTWFDPIRGASGFAATRFGMYRALGFFSDPNDFGQILVASLAIMLPRAIKENGKTNEKFYTAMCLISIFAIIGTLAAFAIFPAVLVLLLFFSSLTKGFVQKILIFLSIVSIVVIGIWFLDPDSSVTWAEYTNDQVVNSFSYIPQAIATGNWFGQGYGVYLGLAERLGISAGSTADRATYWFYHDQITPQIGLLGMGIWTVLWIMFMYQGYQNQNRISQRESLDFQLYLGVWLSLIGIFVSSLHYGPYRVGGVDLLFYILWAFISTEKIRKTPEVAKDYS
ncbi:MAG TPA: hypothetical protein ENN32_07590 [Chloroflexi bacterium]|nr:hypothetical protein [Chloroflexota bacterium]